MSRNWLNKITRASLPTVPGNLAFVRIFLALSAGLGIAALPRLFEHGKLSGNTWGTYSAQWLILLGIVTLLAVINLLMLVLSLTGQRVRIAEQLSGVQRWLEKRPLLVGLGVLTPWAAYVLLVLYRYQKHFSDFPPQVWLFFLAAGIGAFFLAAAWKNVPFFWALLFTAVLYSGLVKALGYLPEITSFPFSLAWSEGSRYYYASLPYSHWLYGMDIPLSSLHPTRYLLQGMAFWAPEAGIAFHRFWQVALWLLLSLLAGMALARRLRTGRAAIMWGVTVWSALFLLQGPVYYHLLVCVVLVLWGFDRTRFWKSLFFVILGSLWAGISRVNWIPVPAILAATLYLLESPVCASARAGAKSWLAVWARYLWRPLAWGAAGCAAALLSQAAYVLVSGQEDISQFGSSFTSALLWYRLLPSPTFPLGVIPAVLLVSAPLLVLVIGGWLRGRSDWHLLRILGISLMSMVLFAGGLVVSTKIGGGSNLHNMDAFFVLLWVIGVIMLQGEFASETGGWPRAWRPWPLLMIATLLPVIWNLNVGDPFIKRDFAQAEYDLNKLNARVQQYAAEGDVLFINQRQLQVYGLIPGVRLVPDYELISLTEMSISNNRDYLERFYSDLREHRFALIVAGQQNTAIKDPLLDAFAEENNAWVENIAEPMLEYYREEMFFDTQGIQLLVPIE